MNEHFKFYLGRLGRRSASVCAASLLLSALTPLVGHAAPRVPALAAPGAPLAESAVHDWTQPLRHRARPDAASLVRRLEAAPRRELVTIRNAGGRPRVEVTRLGRGPVARAAIDKALADPKVLSVSTSVRVTVQDAGWSEPPTGVAAPAPPRLVDSPGIKNRPVGVSLRSGRSNRPTAADANDPLLAEQWGLKRLDAPRLWFQSGEGLPVAVIDTGVQANHPDLADVVLPGYDFIAGEATPAGAATDPFGHGTHVAGIIAARAGNGVGGAGLAQGARIMPVRVLDATGSGTDAMVAQGVIWATDHGAKVINLSIGSPEYSAAEAAAVAYAVSHGVVVVAAAGNYRGYGNPAVYPAAFPGVIGVSAVDQTDHVATFSSSGPSVDLAAPGVGIVSTYPVDRYSTIDGTSMATPFVAASAALVRAAAPKLGPAAVAELLERSAVDLSPRGRDSVSGAGVVQPLAALAQLGRVPQLPAVRTGSVTALMPVGVPVSTRYGSTLTTRFRLVSAGRGIPAQKVRICHTVAPASRRTCATAVSDRNGGLTQAIRVTGTMRIWAEFPGRIRWASVSAAPLTVRALPELKVSSAPGALRLAMSPATPGTEVRLQLRTPSGWVTESTQVSPASGAVTVRGLRHGQIYRFAVSGNSRTSAAVSSAHRLR